MITLRLDEKLEQNINDVAQQLGLSKSELIRQSITEFIAKIDKPSPWELGADLFGKYGSDHESLSRDRKQLFYERIEKKHRRK